MRLKISAGSVDVVVSRVPQVGNDLMVRRWRSRVPVRPVYGSALAAMVGPDTEVVIGVNTAEQLRVATQPARHSNHASHHCIDHRASVRVLLTLLASACAASVAAPDQTTQRPSRNAAPGRGLNLLPPEVRRGAPGTANADQVGYCAMTAILQTTAHMRAAYALGASLCGPVSCLYGWRAYTCPVSRGHMRSRCWRLVLSVRVYRCPTRPTWAVMSQREQANNARPIAKTTGIGHVARTPMPFSENETPAHKRIPGYQPYPLLRHPPSQE
jgi:hypothetical protein